MINYNNTCNLYAASFKSITPLEVSLTKSTNFLVKFPREHSNLLEPIGKTLNTIYNKSNLFFAIYRV